MRPIRFASFHLILLGTEQQWSQQTYGFNLLASGIPNPRDNFTSSPKPLLRCYCYIVLPLVYNPLIDPFILSYSSSFFQVIMYYFLPRQNPFKTFIVLALIL